MKGSTDEFPRRCWFHLTSHGDVGASTGDDVLGSLRLQARTPASYDDLDGPGVARLAAAI